MTAIELLHTLPYVLISIIFLNRYCLGLLAKAARWRSLAAEDATWEPTVAIVVPLFNEGDIIYRTISCLLQQNYPAEKLSVIVVDDCSTDDSYEWAMKAAAADRRVTVLRNLQNMGKRKGINHAVRMADAEVIVSVDSDALLDKDALRRLIPKFASPEIAAVGGRVNVLNANENWLTKMQAIKYFFGYEYLKNLENSFFSVMCLSGCLTAYRRSVLIELEPILENRNVLGVPIKYGEDRFLTRQIVKAGYKTRLTLDALCYTKAPSTLSKLFSQQLRWRRSNIIDYICGMSHGWRMHPLVAVHYFSLFCLLMVYPVTLMAALMSGSFFGMFTLHLGLLAIYSVIYAIRSQSIEKEYRVHPAHFLSLAFLMPVTYIVLTALALFTLDSDSWETRKPVLAEAVAATRRRASTAS